MEILILSAVLFFTWLFAERVLLDRRRSKIPLRITVTGTRGKSSVSRLLASVLTEGGYKVLAKTTGSEAKYIFPGGEEVDVPRIGRPSIIEQKRLIKKAAAFNADCLIAEIMSIYPENHYVESRRILKPEMVLITNTYPDHTDAIGKTEEDISEVYSLDISGNAKVFIPEAVNNSLFSNTAEKMNSSIVEVARGVSEPVLDLPQKEKAAEFTDNIDLVYAAASHLKIPDEKIKAGINNVKYDIGRFSIKKYLIEKSGNTVILVNAFAANEPESTYRILSKVESILPSYSRNFIGLLTLRSDRADRTAVWVDFFRENSWSNFEKMYVTGAFENVVKRNVRGVEVLKHRSPEKIMDAILENAENGDIIFGFGNMKGTGKELVEYWNKIGEDYGV